jgi:alanine dehydrogenase
VIIGVPRETKSGEQRVALTPAGAQALVALGHRVLVEPGAGLGSGIRDEEYTAVGASLEPADTIWEAGLVLKVKEPIAAEYGRLHGDQILFTYLHLAAVPELTHVLRKTDTIALAY